MTTELAPPPRRDLPPERLAVRREHLLAEIARNRGRAPRRATLRRLAALAAAVLVVLAGATAVLATGLGVFGRHDRVFRWQATLQPVGDGSATGKFTARPAHRFFGQTRSQPPLRLRFFTTSLRWRLTYDGVDGPVSARIVTERSKGDRVVKTLCSPCDSPARGTIGAPRRVVFFSTVEVLAQGEPVLRGRLRLAR